MIFQQHKEHPGVKFPRGVDLFFFVRGTPRTHTHTKHTICRGPLALESTMLGPNIYEKTFKKQKKGGWETLRRSPPGEDIQEAEEGRLGNLAPFAAGG